MAVWSDFVAAIDDPNNRAKLTAVFEWIEREYPQLEARMAWNQPMYTDHGTFIIGFSVAKKHFNFTPEKAVIPLFAADFERAGYIAKAMLVSVPWSAPVDYDLLDRVIAHNIADKADCTTFWRR